MSLSADQREAIAEAAFRAWRTAADTNDSTWLAVSDAPAPLVDGWLGEARRDERDKMRKQLETLPAAHAVSADEDRAIWRYHAIEAVDRLGVIEGSEATDA